MSDRELLEKAAGAFGVPAREEGGYLYAALGEISTSGWGIVTWCGLGTVQFWNPLVSNDDAFRMAVKLRLEIVPVGGDYIDVCKPGSEPFACACERGEDRCAATRRAIVRAAAALADATPSPDGSKT